MKWAAFRDGYQNRRKRNWILWLHIIFMGEAVWVCARWYTLHGYLKRLTELVYKKKKQWTPPKKREELTALCEMAIYLVQKCLRLIFFSWLKLTESIYNLSTSFAKWENGKIDQERSCRIILCITNERWSVASFEFMQLNWSVFVPTAENRFYGEKNTVQSRKGRSRTSLATSTSNARAESRKRNGNGMKSIKNSKCEFAMKQKECEIT